jgi:hypothetical protein
MSATILAAALELSRIHGVQYAAFFLLDRDVEFEVIAELLWNSHPRHANGQNEHGENAVD